MHYQTFIQPAVASAASVLAVISTLSAEEQKTVYESLQQSLGQ